MATEISSSIKKKKPPGFMTLLSSAACEWFLIFLLFLDAAFAYLLTRFANYCGLETPCLLCSRLDLVWGKKKPECYWSVLCPHHREEISSLASCSAHGKVADVHGMCEECLMPMAKQDKASPECYRLLVGKLWVDVERSVLQHLLLNKYVQLGFSGRRTCSCCNKTWRAKSNADRLLEFTQVGYGASKANVKPPLPRVPGRSRFSRRDSLKRIRDKFTGPVPPSPTVSDSGDSLSYVGYSKLKISSDSESEITISEDDDDGNASTRGKSYATSEDDVQFSRSGVTKKLADNVVSGKSTNQSLPGKSVSLDQLNLLDLSEQKIVNSLSSDVLTELGLRELDWAETFHTPRPSFTDELITLDDGYHTPDAGRDSIGALSAGMSNSGISPAHMPALSVLSEILSLYNGPSSSTMAIQEKPNNSEETSGRGNVSPVKEIKAASSDKASSSDAISMNITVQSGESRELLGVHEVKPNTIRDSAKTEEHTQSLPQVSTSEVRLSSKDDSSSSRAHVKHVSASMVIDGSRKDENSVIQALPVSASPMKDSYRKNEEFGSQEFAVSVSHVNNDSEKDKDSISHTLAVSASSLKHESKKDEASIRPALPVSASLVKDISGKDEDSSSQALSNSAPLVKNDSNKDKDSISQALPVSDSVVKHESGKELNSSSQALSTSAAPFTRQDVDSSAQALRTSASALKSDSSKDEGSSTQVLPVSDVLVKNESRRSENSSPQALPVSAPLVKYESKNIEGYVSMELLISETPVKSSSGEDEDSSPQGLFSESVVKNDPDKDNDSSSPAIAVPASMVKYDAGKDENSNSQVLQISASVVESDSVKSKDSSSQVLPVSAPFVETKVKNDEYCSSQVLPASTSREKNDSGKDEDSNSPLVPVSASIIINDHKKDEDSGSQMRPIPTSPVKNDSKSDEDSSSHAHAPAIVIDESIYESLDGITVSFMKGETLIDLLRRQVDHDQTLMKSLYKELEALKSGLRKDEGSTSQALPVSTSQVGSENKKDEHSNFQVLPISASMVINDSKKDEGSSPQMLPIPTSPVKNDSKQDESSSSQLTSNVIDESSYESLDGITVSFMEGETIVDLLKRQVDHDRTLMNSLYKELEEERSASSIAANETMAMITRLQEEKAALHMEALQYLRMMEEQAEYDMEALERANGLLAEKEKELQDLEYELEFYRMNILDESGEQEILKEPLVEKNEVAVHTENGPAASSHTKSFEILKANGDHKPMISSVSKFEDEKLYISQRIKKLEEKLHQTYNGQKLDSVPDGLNSENNKQVSTDLKDLPPSSQTTENKDGSSVVQKDGVPAEVTTSNGGMHDKQNDNKLSARGEIVSDTQKEIAQLHERLEALEADREFLRHASDLLHSGKDGSHFIQEIAHQLQELRKLEFKKR